MNNKQKTHTDYFNQYIQHKALAFKFDDSDKLLDMMLSQKENEEQIGGVKFKNVCAKLTEQLVDRMENTCGVLQISKRKFIELAVIEALERCDAIIEEVDPFEHRTVESEN
jgi:hypothetical protein